MAWSAPMTAVANSAFTAAQFNAYVRDNLLETAPAKATSSGRLMVTTGANQIAERQATQADVPIGQTTTSSSFTDLATVGPQVSVVTGSKALVWFGAQMSNTAANVVMQVAVNISGATTQAPDTTADLYFDGLAAGNAFRATTVHMFTNLTPGTNTFKLQYRVGAGTGTFYDRSLGVIAF